MTTGSAACWPPKYLSLTQLEESEEKMLFIDDEETEILVEVGNYVVQQLMNDLARELSLIHSC